MKNLPSPSKEAIEISQKLDKYIRQKFANRNVIEFDKWLKEVLYAPSLGYYNNALPIFGSKGDFVTAPEISHFFGKCLGNQIRQILEQCDSKHILEFGAGSGAMAKQILKASTDAHIKYFILELSADLRTLQQNTLSEYADRIVWLDSLPEKFQGCILANEVLDSIPPKIFEFSDSEGHIEIGVRATEVGYEFAKVGIATHKEVLERIPNINGYRSEINFQAEAWIRSLAGLLTNGGILLIDYGFSRSEYYHPQRNEGTIMCHFKHHTHSNPLINIGIQDITSHVDFTAVADSAIDAGLELWGYTTQASFLISCGLEHELLKTNDLSLSQKTGINTLISEAEMGELFKVMLFSKNLDWPEDPLGFRVSDRRYSL
ncbi:class I SAM-dependent methyltransferase [Taylorella equigenitalis]|uniref:class I SAM-dependent methyltransferase n=1 Tax=Taylorella equigenitalis TaxID=29575 RepID=UPI0003F60E7D|nr:SAM-dependent methyltransferase [Taylorella equigenitalis]WDU53196.1 SAM-dependent methyltransferase [Taylorella equigenitalis]